MNLRNGIYIKSYFTPERIFYYILAHSKGQTKYLHKDGQWLDTCYNPFRDKSTSEELMSGHYASKEAAIENVKKYTRFIMIYNHKNEEEYI